MSPKTQSEGRRVGQRDETMSQLAVADDADGERGSGAVNSECLWKLAKARKQILPWGLQKEPSPADQGFQTSETSVLQNHKIIN